MSDEMPARYDNADPASIERYAQALVGTSLRKVLSGRTDLVQHGGKGGFGQMVEELYFGYKANSTRGPDFPDAGVELKTSPLKRLKDGALRSKERLVLNIINYEELAREHGFDESSFWHKNALLLLLFYIWVENQEALDYIFHLARLWRFPESDLKIIRDDWETIARKVRGGLAHELSERDTNYLAACTKGADSGSMRDQPGGVRAKQRAFSLKSSYINRIIDQSGPGSTGPVLVDLTQLKPTETFEQYVVRKLSAYYGRTEQKLKDTFKLEYSPLAKHRYYLLAKAMLGVTADRIEEFEKAGIVVKSIRVEADGDIREAMSFKQIQYRDIVQQTWEESMFFAELDRRFLFIVFRRNTEGELRFERCGFWAIPEADLEQARQVWEDTKSKVIAGRYSSFIKSTENPVSHVRTKGKDSHDLMRTPQGTLQTKRCFWLNRDYIMEQLAHLAR